MIKEIIELGDKIINKINEQENNTIVINANIFSFIKQLDFQKYNITHIIDYNFIKLLFMDDKKIQTYYKMNDKYIILNANLSFNDKSLYLYVDNSIETDGLVPFYTITDNEFELMY